MSLGPEKYSRGVWLSLDISKSVRELDCALQDRAKKFTNTRKIQNILQSHYEQQKNKTSLGFYEGALELALGFDVIPKVFNITQENCKSYNQEDYLAGMGLILEQFEDLESASEERLIFLRDFMTDLCNYRLSRLESPYRCLAA